MNSKHYIVVSEREHSTDAKEGRDDGQSYMSKFFMVLRLGEENLRNFREFISGKILSKHWIRGYIR